MCQFCHTPHIHDYPHCGYEMPPHHHPHFHHPHPPVVRPNVVLKRPNVYNSVVAINILKDMVTVLMDDGTYYQSPISIIKDTRTEDNTNTPTTNP